MPLTPAPPLAARTAAEAAAFAAAAYSARVGHTAIALLAAEEVEGPSDVDDCCVDAHAFL
jgi:hypothetical protein